MIGRWQATQVAIGVPVRDEAALLPPLLAALAAQRVPAGIAVTACFLFDGCHDASAALVAGAGLPFAVRTASLPREALPNAGRARRAALALADDIDADGLALLTTDADTVPAPDWLANACAALGEAELVAGRIERDGAHDPAQDRLEHYYDRLHRWRRRLDPVAWEAPVPHHQAGGANLAIRAAAYRALGGFAPLAAGEDARLIDAAERAGLRVRRDPGVRVVTSARRRGRANGGLAQHLATLDRDGASGIEVTPPAALGWQYRGHAAARRAWPAIDGEGDRLARLLDCPVDHVRRVAADAANAHGFAIRVVPAAPHGDRLVPLAEAEAALAELDSRCDGRAA